MVAWARDGSVGAEERKGGADSQMVDEKRRKQRDVCVKETDPRIDECVQCAGKR